MSSRGSLVPIDDDTSSARLHPNTEALKLERLAKLKEERAMYDTVTLGGARKPKPPAKPTAPGSSEGHTVDIDNAPVYRFQIAEAFEHDIPNMKAPSGVTLRQLVPQFDSSRRSGRSVIPLSIAGTSSGKDPMKETGDGPDSSHADMKLVPHRTQPSDPDEMLMASIQLATTAKRPNATAVTAGETVAPNDELEITSLHNAEDVVSYFSLHGSERAVKFVYCNRTPQLLDFRPYDLTVVLRGHQQPEHFVISASGVVHIKPGQPAEVMTLSDWMQEAAMFNVLRRIHFFRTYLVYKAMTQWRKNIRLRLYCMTRRALCRRFFISKSTFASTTLDLHKSAYELTTTPLMHYEHHGKHDYSIDEFNRDQLKQRTVVATEFGSVLERIESRLTKLTEMIQQRANVPDLTTMESLEQYLLANSIATGKDRKGSKKMKSMLEAKQEQHERMRELKRSMVEHSMLDNYIRLIDYIAAESIFKNALLTVLHFYSALHSQLDKDVKTVGFQILIQPGEDQMVYRPNEADIVKVYSDMVEEMITTVNGVNRLMNQKPLKMFFAKPPKLWNISTEFKRDARVIMTKQNTYALIAYDFTHAQERKKNYDRCMKWVWYIKRDWPERKVEWESRMSKKELLTHDEINAEYHQLLDAQDMLKNLSPTNVGYMLFINAGRLKSELQPKIEAIKADVDSKLTVTARERTQRLQRYFTEQGKLISVPSEKSNIDFHRFAEFVRALNEALRRQAEIERDADEAENLYNLMIEQSVEIEDTDKGLRERTLGSGQQASGKQPMREHFSEQIMRATEFRDARRAGMIAQLTNQIEDINRRASELNQNLGHEEYTVSHFSVDVTQRQTTENDVDPTAVTLGNLAALESDIKSIEERSKLLSSYQELFEASPLAQWRELQALITHFNARKEAWTLKQIVYARKTKWFATRLTELDVASIESTVREIKSRVVKVLNVMKSEGLNDAVAKSVAEDIDQLSKALPAIRDIGNEHLNPKDDPHLAREYWNKILRDIAAAQPYTDDLCLDTLCDCDIWAEEHLAVLREQVSIAAGEAELGSNLKKIQSIWEAVEFGTKKYREDKEVVYILDKVEDIILQLDDHHMLLQGIAASPYVAGVRSRVEEWVRHLRIVSDVIEEWITMQKNWMYLEFIFSSADIKIQLKTESEAFDSVDKFFKSITTKAATVKNVLSICVEPGLLDTLRANNKEIDVIQKRLEDYLETKRAAFPRFYFLSNDELLSILSDVRNPRAVQPHLTKCFDSIHSLIFGNDAATEITGMKSGEGEEVPFERVVHPVGSVEFWLGVIEGMMKTSLHMHMRETIDAYPRRKREEWFFEFPAQCIQAVDMIQWTSETEQAIVEHRVPAFREQYHEQILMTVDIVKRQLSKLQRTLACTLIVVDVHNRDIVGRLAEMKVSDIMDFEWQQQLRYYWENDSSLGANNVGIHHSTAHLWYGYEYLGNQPRLVITPLTDRAFLTCTSALEMNLGAAPQGPAGTGKTESVKDLGKALARQVVVFNCSDGINYKTMSRMFAGLAQAGAWACFDEFNRIELEVLSVIAQQMLEIVSALAQKMEHMDFDGHEIKLSKNFGVFITMNPGYAGRTELPDNLKALFRPICMMIPDYALIAEIMFYSEGFADARTLANKMVQLYKLSSEQLSKQDHYDFGMRAVKSILVMAGSLKRANPDESEDMLLIRAMRDSNVPKFLREDTVLFMALIKDLFPTFEVNDIPNEQLVKYLTKDLQENNLQVVEGFLLKARQLFDTMIVRHGVMTVGQTMCAKTAILESLKRTLTAMKHDNVDSDGTIPLCNVVHTHTLNPKSVTMGELYGEVNAMTREWTDGLLSGIARNIKSESNYSQDRHWIVFDGPVDAVWIENMNTVLDDNKMLCLFNGERIKLPPTASFVFEVQDLKVASPATVSRCGMVYVEPYYLDGGWQPIAQSLALRLAETVPKKMFLAQRAITLLGTLAPKTIAFIRRHCVEYIASVDAQLAVSCLMLLHGFVVQPPEDDRSTRDLPASTEEGEEPDALFAEFRRPTAVIKSVPPNPSQLFDMQFVMSFIWSFGANLSDASRQSFSDFLMPVLSEVFPFIPQDKGAFDICIHRPSLSFISWDYVVPDFAYRHSMPYFDLFVPTVETTSMKTIMTVLSGVSRNMILNGVTGTGKSLVIMDLIVSTLNADSPDAKWEYFATALSAQTRSIDLQERIESKLIKVKSNLLGPPPGKRMLLFIDDLNMPALEKYGASPPIELLRQVVSQQGFYDRKKVPSVFKEIRDMVIVGACGVPGGGRNELTQRLTSQFHLLCQPIVTTQSMRRIFSLILGGFLSLWPSDVRQMTSKIVEATRQCYERISREKLPTPQKSHYTFNLRDFGKVFQGILQVSPEGTPDRESMLRLFMHEVTRVFHDRLTDEEDKRWWWTSLAEVCRSEFDLEWSREYETILFGDFMKRDGKGNYVEIVNFPELQERLIEYQASYNMEMNKETELVFFQDAAHHIARICRICRQPRGNALLVGVGGSGRQSLTRLAAYMYGLEGMPVFQISVSRSFGVAEFRDNLKEALLMAGLENRHIVFLLADNQIVKEQFLEDINNILNTGEVPNLMQADDNDKIIESCRKYVRALGKPETRGVILNQFTQQCRDNLHIVLTMSPIGEQFRRRLRMFPSLVSCTTIDWFTKWPSEALEGVASRVLAKMNVPEEHKPALARMCVKIHEDVDVQSQRFFDELRRHNYTTPTSYLELLNSYSKMFDEQVGIVQNQLNRLQGGLDKLAQTQVLVDEMKESLKKMQPELEKAAKDTERIMAEVEVQTKEAEVKRADCAKEDAASQIIREEATGVRKECQERLDEAMPAYYDALDALKALDARDISEMKALPQPPDRVRVVVEAVLVLLGVKDLSWNSCKAVMGRSDFLTSLREYKKDDVPDKIIRTLQKNYINNSEIEFTPENVARASVAAKSLCLWVRAIDNYNTVAKQIAPKKEQLADAEAKLAAAEASARAAKAQLQGVEDNIAALNRDMEANLQRKKNLEDEMKLCELRLGRAATLMTGLASEQTRWTETVELLYESRKDLVGTVVIAAGAVAYLGPFTAPYRRSMMASWAVEAAALGIPVGEGQGLAGIADPIKVRQWGQKGLPLDDFSVENGVIVSRSQRWCLCIDPQGQANNWIRAMERNNNLSIIKLSEPNYMSVLEQAVKFGYPVLLENVEETLDAVIDPILLRQTFREQGMLRIKLGDQPINYSPSFRMYLTTKLPNPHYMPELQIKVTIVNFTVTQLGLEEQLLADVVRYERADLEQRADRTVTEIAEGKTQLKEIEERILSLLASSTGNILDNEALIIALGDAKKTSTSVTQNLEIAEATQKDIHHTRDKYRPVATRGSLIYSVIANISGIEHMYQYSLDFFKRLFLQTLKRTERSDDVAERVNNLLPAVTLDSYNTVCRGLFECDKQLFAFLMLAEILRASREFKDDEWLYFLRGSEGQKLADPDSWPSWSSEYVWNEVLALCELEPFTELKNVVWADEHEWSAWSQSETAFNNVPAAYEHLSPWQQLLLVKAFREDLLMYGLTRVVGHYLGKEFTESPAFNLDASFEDSSTTAPIIFVLTPGTDPTSTFTEFAEKKGFADKKLMLSLGQDQGPKAVEMIATATRTGQWVYLQNCHVYASWMPTLERQLEEIMLKDVHKDFRLWLTTMPTTSFPVLVLQSGIKVTKEPPKGLKANLKDSFLQEVTPELWSSCKNSGPWKRLLFSMSFFHAVIQERRKFGALGWNIPYEWNQSDYSASIKSLYTYLSDHETTPWPALKYMIGVINYGGRVTDFLDSRCLQTIMAKFFDPEVLHGLYNITADGVYCVPADVADLDEVKKYLDQLPPYETPELFGLHPNADITYNRNTSRRLLDAILSVQPRSSSGSGLTPDERVFAIADEFLRRLPALIDKDNAHEDTYRITESGTMTSLGTVVGQEIDVFNRINLKLSSTLAEVKRAIHGEVVMSSVLESIYNAFLVAKVPENWHEGSYLSRKPLASWFDDTVARIEFLRDWNDNGPPTSFWLSGFFFPQGFLTAVLQTHARAFKVPIDDIKFRTHVTDMQTSEQVDDPPEVGVYVHGLFMEGARFNRDTSCVDESLPGELFTTMPVIWLQPVQRNEVTSRSDTYACPMYKTTARAGALSTTGLSTNFVLSLDLNSGATPPDHWIRRGVALLCMLDD